MTIKEFQTELMALIDRARANLDLETLVSELEDARADLEEEADEDKESDSAGKPEESD